MSTSVNLKEEPMIALIHILVNLDILQSGMPEFSTSSKPNVRDLMRWYEKFHTSSKAYRSRERLAEVIAHLRGDQAERSHFDETVVQ